MPPGSPPASSLITRRRLLGVATGALAASTGMAGYAVGIEPYRTLVTRYVLSPPHWTRGLSLRIAAIADLHICEPFMGLARLESIVDQVNRMLPDVVVLLGDYVPGGGMQRYARSVEAREWARILNGLRAPSGVHAILGNHDWWEDREAQRTMKGPTEAGRSLMDAGVHLHQNTAIKLTKDARAFWLVGLGDQWAFYGRRDHPLNRNRSHFFGVDDLDAALGAVTDNAPVVLLLHEPDAFPRVPDRVSLTLAGHTHGGQIRMLGYAPVVPSRYGRRYAYGHIVEQNRNLIVSAGLGCSGIPVRFGSPPEIVVVEASA
jgi:predicted MPP superfamily phosphohydrolase